ncbi:metal-binding protein [Pandoraea sp. ISTKB]|uniref:metal-binding protein n=1 Tax=Pandoraea sp. ISTKB TaxID=1586708 RepID=UPI001112EEF5|nr:metal-binding protein [Pandoraea sp. ISTKB]
MTENNQKMKCDCDSHPAIRSVNGTLHTLFPGFRHEDAAHWRSLLRCPACGQLWAVDEWEKHQVQLAVKVADVQGWRASDEALRKERLTQSRGENAVVKCLWSGCEKYQLNGSAYCVDHLYATGAKV